VKRARHLGRGRGMLPAVVPLIPQKSLTPRFPGNNVRLRTRRTTILRLGLPLGNSRKLPSRIEALTGIKDAERIGLAFVARNNQGPLRGVRSYPVRFSNSHQKLQLLRLSGTRNQSHHFYQRLTAQPRVVGIGTTAKDCDPRVNSFTSASVGD